MSVASNCRAPFGQERGFWGRERSNEKGPGNKGSSMILFKKFQGCIHNDVFEVNSYHYIGGKNFQNCRLKEEIYCCDQGKKYRSYLVR